jgi:hypothetical protein
MKYDHAYELGKHLSTNIIAGTHCLRSLGVFSFTKLANWIAQQLALLFFTKDIAGLNTSGDIGSAQLEKIILRKHIVECFKVGVCTALFQNLEAFLEMPRTGMRQSSLVTISQSWLLSSTRYEGTAASNVRLRDRSYGRTTQAARD